MIKIGIYTVLELSWKDVDCTYQKTPHTLISDIKKHFGKQRKSSAFFYIIFKFHEKISNKISSDLSFIFDL